MGKQIAIVTPVLDDWDSFARLVGEISGRFAGADLGFHVFALDDGSTASFDMSRLALPADTCIADLELVRLAVNLGHQRAIAVGLCVVADRDEFDAVVVMDSDGEDRPEDIATLLAASREQPGHVAFAGRSERSEGRGFRLSYFIYRHLFGLLTGRAIKFGNFVLLPMAAVRRLVHMPELWNHLAAAIMRSRLRYITVPTVRGSRYAGRSRMGLISLIVHGLSAMSVYTDMIFVRVLIATGVVACLALVGIMIVTALRLATDLAIPGWASTVVGDLVIVLMQTGVIIIATSLMMLAGRSNRPIVPIAEAQLFVAGRECWRRGPKEVVPIPARGVR